MKCLKSRLTGIQFFGVNHFLVLPYTGFHLINLRNLSINESSYGVICQKYLLLINPLIFYEGFPFLKIVIIYIFFVSKIINQRRCLYKSNWLTEIHCSTMMNKISQANRLYFFNLFLTVIP